MAFTADLLRTQVQAECGHQRRRPWRSGCQSRYYYPHQYPHGFEIKRNPTKMKASPIDLINEAGLLPVGMKENFSLHNIIDTQICLQDL
jgi:hypothetical protein